MDGKLAPLATFPQPRARSQRVIHVDSRSSTCVTKEPLNLMADLESVITSAVSEAHPAENLSIDGGNDDYTPEVETTSDSAEVAEVPEQSPLPEMRAK